MSFKFDRPYDIDGYALGHLSQEPVYTLDGQLGYISHLLVTPRTKLPAWAVVADNIGGHHAIPVELIDPTDYRDQIRVKLTRHSVDSLFDISSPDGTSGHYVRVQVGNILAGLHDTLGGAVELSPAMAVNPQGLQILSIASPNDAATIQTTDSGRWSEMGEAQSDDAPDVTPPTLRSLVANLPESVSVSSQFGVEISVVEEVAGAVPAGSPLNVRGGMTIAVNAIVPGSFEVHGAHTQEIVVPQAGDSDPRLFTFTPREVGTFTIRFTAFNEGSFLGKLDVEVSVAGNSSGTSRYEMKPLPLGPPRLGEVSLQITYDDASKTFRFLFIAGGDRCEVPSVPVKGDVNDQIENLVLEFNTYAEGSSDLPADQVEERMKTRGFQLWSGLVPDPIKERILNHLKQMTQLTIFCDREIVPWELLYPQFPDGTEPGFLVQLCPVTRWVMGSQWKQALSLANPTFVVPTFVVPAEPSAQDREVELIAEKLHSTNPKTLRERKNVLDAMARPKFTCLHFACHNTYTANGGSQIAFTDGSLCPSDFERQKARQPLGDKAALVFLNACRTQGSVAVYTGFEDWAKMFLDLGATAVIGTSWAIRSSTARSFAEDVYENLAAGRTLGEAMEAARLIARERVGDSSWLAYTVYGDPTARVLDAR
jgi:hypothetical protein